MSSKSDTDNRSNQLNPNNDAYHSSRGVGCGDDDDDDDDVSSYSPSRSFAQQQHQEKMRIQAQIDSSPIREYFKLDVMFLDGRKAHLGLTTEIPYKHFRQGNISDGIDLVEAVAPKLFRLWANEAKVGIAYSLVRDSKGNALPWIGPTFPSMFHLSNRPRDPDKRAAQDKELAMWESLSKPLIPEFKAYLAANEPSTRVEFEQVITPHNYQNLKR